jgi:hypothetical protein
MAPSSFSGQPKRSAGADVLGDLGYQLRAVYSDLLREPIPEHLAAIVERLESRKRHH